MDLNTVTDIDRPRRREELPAWREGDALLAGGTWLFSEPQPHLRRLIDLAALDWPPLEPGAEGLRIGATCTLAQLAASEPPPAWPAAALFAPCCRALRGAHKIWNAATVGGNLCLALPAGADGGAGHGAGRGLRGLGRGRRRASPAGARLRDGAGTHRPAAGRRAAGDRPAA